jgi:hypothetical protein
MIGGFSRAARDEIVVLSCITIVSTCIVFYSVKRSRREGDSAAGFGCLIALGLIATLTFIARLVLSGEYC